MTHCSCTSALNHTLKKRDDGTWLKTSTGLEFKRSPLLIYPSHLAELAFQTGPGTPLPTNLSLDLCPHRGNQDLWGASVDHGGCKTVEQSAGSLKSQDLYV